MLLRREPRANLGEEGGGRLDALGSERVYKKAWELDRILDLFREERGEHFDPKMVDVFFDSLDEILEVRERYQDAQDLIELGE